MFRFSVSLVFALLLTTSIQAEETTPKNVVVDKTRRDDSDSESSDGDDSSSSTPDTPPASMSFAHNFRLPAFNFPPPGGHPHFGPSPPMYAQIPPPPMMYGPSPHHHPHHSPYHMMPAASSYTAFYRPLPPPMPHMGHMMSPARMSLHPMHPLASPFMPPPPPSRTMLPVMVPIKRWDHSSIFDSLINSDSGLDNAFLDEPLVFDEEELLAARRHISSPPPPAHRRESFDHFSSRRHKNRDRDSYEPIPSENRYDEPVQRHTYKSERHDYEDRYDHQNHRDHRDHHHDHESQDRHSTRAGHMIPPPPPPPTSPSFERYEDHTPSRDMSRAPSPPAEHMPLPVDDYSHSRDP